MHEEADSSVRPPGAPHGEAIKHAQVTSEQAANSPDTIDSKGDGESVDALPGPAIRILDTVIALVIVVTGVSIGVSFALQDINEAPAYETAWAQEIHTVPLLREYIAHYPDRPLGKLALEELNALEARAQQAFEAARAAGTLEVQNFAKNPEFAGTKAHISTINYLADPHRAAREILDKFHALNPADTRGHEEFLRRYAKHPFAVWSGMVERVSSHLAILKHPRRRSASQHRTQQMLEDFSNLDWDNDLQLQEFIFDYRTFDAAHWTGALRQTLQQIQINAELRNDRRRWKEQQAAKWDLQ